MRVMITGGYGCIGSWTARKLLERGAEVWVYDLTRETRRMDQLMTAEEVARIGHVDGDVVDVERLAGVFAEKRITQVLHLAALQVPACRADPLLGARVNVLGTLAIFEAVRRVSPQVDRVVYASSASVFGPPSLYGSGALGSDIELLPSSHYGAFKVCNESNARVYWQDHQISSIGLHPWTVYGVGRDQGMTSGPTKAIKAVVLGRAYQISYGGWQDLQYVEDVAAAFLRCLKAPYRGSGIYNLRGSPVEMQEFVRSLAAVEPEAAHLVSHGDRQLEIAYDIDDAALRRDIGEIPATPLVDGIRRTVAHFRRLAVEGRLDASELDA